MNFVKQCLKSENICGFNIVLQMVKLKCEAEDSHKFFILDEIVYFCAKNARNWKIFVISLFADVYENIHFLWIKKLTV